MKSRRQSALLEIIQEYDIDTQEELQERLKQRDFTVTQATISRDIKELKLVKTPVGNGKYKYATGNKAVVDSLSTFNTLFKTAVISVDFAQNIIVVKTTSGMAQGVCATIDSIEWDGMLGSIAGDDTIFIVASTTAKAATLASELKRNM
ncbi:MAG: arginine repressor [Acutalibacteraceae bacterium]|nr:arginine repressor [Acutalibacteraceae bacterium]